MLSHQRRFAASRSRSWSELLRLKQCRPQATEQQHADNRRCNVFEHRSAVLAQSLTAAKIEDGDREERDGQQDKNDVRHEPLLPEAREYSKSPFAMAKALAAARMVLVIEHNGFDSVTEDTNYMLGK
jgi:hypothetical protein